jgi:hypothetical protein
VDGKIRRTKKEAKNMPRGKELEQLPMANIAPGAGEDASTLNREFLSGDIDQQGPFPSKVQKQERKMKESYDRYNMNKI